MNYQNSASNAMPTANIAVNKSRLKVYSEAGSMPVYYLKKGQEFQIELFNPTSDTIMAKIQLNSKSISQGGLVLRPGERVFLDRYLDVAKKFMFDTYEVSANNEEVKKAIENNGDFKVEFFRERPKVYSNPNWILTNSTFVSGGAHTLTGSLGNYTTGTDPQFLRGTSTGGFVPNAGTPVDTNSFNSSSVNCSASYSNNIGMDSLGFADLEAPAPEKRKRLKTSKSPKTMETGKVEEGSKSDQSFNYVSKEFEYLAFCVVEYKLLPVSQKVNTTQDVNARRYCTQCGRKQGPTDNFCAGCGRKQ